MIKLLCTPVNRQWIALVRFGTFQCLILHLIYNWLRDNRVSKNTSIQVVKMTFFF